MSMIEAAAAKLSQGIARLQAQYYEGAVAAFSDTIAANPQFEPAYRLRSEVYKQLGQGPAAVADLEAVLTITRARLDEAQQSLSSFKSANGSKPLLDGSKPRRPSFSLPSISLSCAVKGSIRVSSPVRNQPLRSMNHTSLGLSAAANGSLQGAAWRRRFRRRTSPARSRTSPAVLGAGHEPSGSAVRSHATTFFGPQFG
jgi:tetratricopeptide (TPR) repeat protein